MTITVPYIFQAGTKAKAQEVNDNFTAIVTEVNSLSSDILKNATDITTLRNTKADLNGNTNNRFSVANPVNSNDAVNKQTLISLTGGGVFGLQVTKSDETHISCTAGATWDTTKNKILSFSADEAIEFSTGSINTTYYVYIIGTADGLQTDLFVSSSSDNPPLPESFTLFKKLAYLQTEFDSGNIDYVVQEGGFNYSLATTNVMPSFGNVQIYSQGTEYLAENDGWMYFERASGTYGSVVVTYRENTFTIPLGANPNTQGWLTTFTMGIPKGAKWRVNGRISNGIYFLPCIGG